jgi:hypothetical protein
METPLSRHHHRRPRDPHAAVPEDDFLLGYERMFDLPADADPKRLRVLMLDVLDKAFPFHPSLPERILLRLGALAEMWRHPTMEAWRTAPCATALDETALRVAATHKLLATGWFEPDGFLAEMLRRMNGQGRA